MGIRKKGVANQPNSFDAKCVGVVICCARGIFLLLATAYRDSRRGGGEWEKRIPHEISKRNRKEYFRIGDIIELNYTTLIPLITVGSSKLPPATPLSSLSPHLACAFVSPSAVLHFYGPVGPFPPLSPVSLEYGRLPESHSCANAPPSRKVGECDL